MVVVGAGPAGSATALRLIEEGRSVLLVDRAQFPRRKPCGEFVNPGAVEILAALGLDVLDWPESTRVSSLTLGGGDVPLPAPGVSIKREILDARLFRLVGERGGDIREGVGASGFSDGVLSLSDRSQVKAGVVIAADGSHSALARAAGLVRPTARLARIGWRARLRGLPGEAGAVRMVAAAPGRPGVWGATIHGDGTAVAAGVLPRSQSRRLAKGGAADYVSEVTGAEVLEVATIPCFGHSARVWSDGLLLAGDAARFVDPFTGEGMHHALEGGVLAAETAHEHLAGRALLSDLARRRRGLDGRYRLCDLVQSVVHAPGLAAPLLAWTARRPRALARLVASLVDHAPASHALSPRMLLEVALG